jgi:hypothetical protein
MFGCSFLVIAVERLGQFQRAVRRGMNDLIEIRPPSCPWHMGLSQSKSWRRRRRTRWWCCLDDISDNLLLQYSWCIM